MAVYYKLHFIQDLLNPDKKIPLNLNVVECKTDKSTYKVVRYDKNTLSCDLIPTYGLYRSVIINSKNNVVCFAPPKSIHADTFIEKYSERDVIAEEFVEGTMINLFFDDSIGEWEISTRNTVGATSAFYKKPGSKTFREMFEEATIECKLNVSQLEKSYCYSFVLQHPDNRIVVPFSKPALYLVGMYEITNVPDEGATVRYQNASALVRQYFSNTSVKFPKVYEFDTYKSLIEKYGSMNTPYEIVGVVIKNEKTGERTKIRNPVYEQVRNLKGNQPKLQYQYLCLRKEGKVKDYLKYYPENKTDFSSFRDQIHLFTQTLYNNYISCYVKKQSPLLNFPPQYRTHMFNIHKIYTDELREKKQFVNNTFVQKYVNNLHPSLLMHSLNYHLKKRNVDIIVADNE